MIFLVTEYGGDVKFTPITPSEVPHFAQETLPFYHRAVYGKSTQIQSYTKFTSYKWEIKLCMRIQSSGRN